MQPSTTHTTHFNILNEPKNANLMPDIRIKRSDHRITDINGLHGVIVLYLLIIPPSKGQIISKKIA